MATRGDKIAAIEAVVKAIAEDATDELTACLARSAEVSHDVLTSRVQLVTRDSVSHYCFGHVEGLPGYRLCDKYLSEHNLGDTCLHLAARNDSINCILVLLKAGADPRALNKDLKAPRQVAAGHECRLEFVHHVNPEAASRQREHFELPAREHSPRVQANLLKTVQMNPQGTSGAFAQEAAFQEIEGEQTFDVTLRQLPGVLGFGLVLDHYGGEKEGEEVEIVVGEIKEGTPAALCDVIQEDDLLIAVNGANVYGKPFEDVLEMLRGPSVELRFSREVEVDEEMFEAQADDPDEDIAIENEVKRRGSNANMSKHLKDFNALQEIADNAPPRRSGRLLKKGGGKRAGKYGRSWKQRYFRVTWGDPSNGIRPLLKYYKTGKGNTKRMGSIMLSRCTVGVVSDSKHRFHFRVNEADRGGEAGGHAEDQDIAAVNLRARNREEMLEWMETIEYTRDSYEIMISADEAPLDSDGEGDEKQEAAAKEADEAEEEADEAEEGADEAEEAVELVGNVRSLFAKPAAVEGASSASSDEEKGEKAPPTPARVVGVPRKLGTSASDVTTVDATGAAEAADSSKQGAVAAVANGDANVDAAAKLNEERQQQAAEKREKNANLIAAAAAVGADMVTQEKQQQQEAEEEQARLEAEEQAEQEAEQEAEEEQARRETEKQQTRREEEDEKKREQARKEEAEREEQAMKEEAEKEGQTRREETEKEEQARREETEKEEQARREETEREEQAMKEETEREEQAMKEETEREEQARKEESEREEQASKAAEEQPKIEIIEVTLRRDPHLGLGLILEEYETQDGQLEILLGEVVHPSPAFQSGMLRVEDELLEVNGTVTKGLVLKDVTGMLGVPEVRLKLSRMLDDEDDSDDDDDYEGGLEGGGFDAKEIGKEVGGEEREEEEREEEEREDNAKQLMRRQSNAKMRMESDMRVTGTMYKKGQGKLMKRRKWKRRYFVLDVENGLLKYYYNIEKGKKGKQKKQKKSKKKKGKEEDGEDNEDDEEGGSSGGGTFMGKKIGELNLAGCSLDFLNDSKYEHHFTITAEGSKMDATTMDLRSNSEQELDEWNISLARAVANAEASASADTPGNVRQKYDT
jgi:hypothetical protein